MKLKFEPEAIRFLKTIEKTNKSIFLTGKAGSGKSTLLNYWKEKTKKRHIFLGTTGVSAEMIGGVTIHKFFKLRPGKKGSWYCAMDNDLKEFIKNNLDSIIIDEASMERADLFDMIDKIMRKATGVDEFFGGKQLILVGDLFQLPPVPEKEYIDREKTKENPAYEKYCEEYGEKLFFFHAKSFDINDFEIIQLKKVYRQSNQEFVNMLNLIRDGFNTQNIVNYFNQKFIQKKDIHPKAILICTTNNIAYNYNKEKLDELPGKTINSKAFISGDYPVEMFPNDLWINYKVGARVMFTVNHPDGYYVNGTLGTIKQIYGNSILIVKDNGSSVEVGRKQWQNIDGEDEDGNPIILGTFAQFPFKCAFAITIHKSQGKSFEYVVIDLGRGAFVAGQLYVAVSRAITFEGLQFLTKVRAKDIFADKDVIEFLKLNK